MGIGVRFIQKNKIKKIENIKQEENFLKNLNKNTKKLLQNFL